MEATISNSTLQITLSKSDEEPWGFRITGGTDFGAPLMIVKVYGGSIAEKAGLQVDDILVAINEQPITNLTHQQAYEAFLNAGNSFLLRIIRGSHISSTPPNVAMGMAFMENEYITAYSEETTSTEAFERQTVAEQTYNTVLTSQPGYGLDAIIAAVLNQGIGSQNATEFETFNDVYDNQDVEKQFEDLSYLLTKQTSERGEHAANAYLIEEAEVVEIKDYKDEGHLTYKNLTAEQQSEPGTKEMKADYQQQLEAEATKAKTDYHYSEQKLSEAETTETKGDYQYSEQPSLEAETTETEVVYQCNEQQLEQEADYQYSKQQLEAEATADYQSNEQELEAEATESKGDYQYTEQQLEAEATADYQSNEQQLQAEAIADYQSCKQQAEATADYQSSEQQLQAEAIADYQSCEQQLQAEDTADYKSSEQQLQAEATADYKSSEQQLQSEAITDYQSCEQQLEAEATESKTDHQYSEQQLEAKATADYQSSKQQLQAQATADYQSSEQQLQAEAIETVTDYLYRVQQLEAEAIETTADYQYSEQLEAETTETKADYQYREQQLEAKAIETTADYQYSEHLEAETAETKAEYQYRGQQLEVMETKVTAVEKPPVKNMKADTGTEKHHFLQMKDNREKKQPLLPLMIHPRPVLQAGGIKITLPKDVYDDEFIAETLSGNAEIITGTTLGVNFHKYRRNYDYLKSSSVYQLIHEEESKKGSGT